MSIINRILVTLRLKKPAPVVAPFRGVTPKPTVQQLDNSAEMEKASQKAAWAASLERSGGRGISDTEGSDRMAFFSQFQTAQEIKERTDRGSAINSHIKK